MRIGMIPAPTADEWGEKANPHLSILTTLLAKQGWEFVPLDYAQVTHPRRLDATGVDLIWVHWPSALFDIQAFSSSGRLAHLARLMRSKADSAAMRLSRGTLEVLLRAVQCLHGGYVNVCASQSIKGIVSGLEACTIPVVWELHDLGSHHIVCDANLARFDRELHHELYRICSAIVVHERSCLQPIVEEFGENRPYAVAELGPYSYGQVVEKHVARRRLGMDASGKVFAYLGTARPNRNPRAAIVAFSKAAGTADRLVLAGMGVRAFLPESCVDPRITIIDRFLLPDEYRDVICAADFVINDGERYLTSAVIRTAMTYGVPVIARPFGAALDMADGAAIYIEGGGLTAAIREAVAMDSNIYARLCAEAHKRNSERTWESSAHKIAMLFRGIVTDEVCSRLQ